jgi:hypothetical protein
MAALNSRLKSFPSRGILNSLGGMQSKPLTSKDDIFLKVAIPPTDLWKQMKFETAKHRQIYCRDKLYSSRTNGKINQLDEKKKKGEREELISSVRFLYIH